MVLQSKNFSKDEIRKTIKVINDYILYEPLPAKEIDVITEMKHFQKNYFLEKKGRFLHDKFGNYMLANANIIKIDNQLHIYTSKHLYSNDPNEFEKQMLRKIPSLKDAQRKEVYKYISLKCQKEGEFSSAKYVGLKDSILDIETMEEFPYSPLWIINNRINFEYDKDCYSKTLDDTFNKVLSG